VQIKAAVVDFHVRIFRQAWRHPTQVFSIIHRCESGKPTTPLSILMGANISPADLNPTIGSVSCLLETDSMKSFFIGDRSHVERLHRPNYLSDAVTMNWVTNYENDSQARYNWR
jgi:hypothetical protein